MPQFHVGLQRIVRLGGAVDDDNSNLLVAQLLYLDSIGKKDITMYVNSPGGSVTAGMHADILTSSVCAVCHISLSISVLPFWSVTLLEYHAACFLGMWSDKTWHVCAVRSTVFKQLKSTVDSILQRLLRNMLQFVHHNSIRQGASAANSGMCIPSLQNFCCISPFEVTPCHISQLSANGCAACPLSAVVAHHVPPQKL